MKYFTLHPVIRYSIPVFNTVTEIELKNLFETRKLNLSKNRSFFLQIGNKIFPETVATEFLDDPEDSWLIHIINNLRSRTDWPETSEENLRKLVKKYENQTTYFIQTLPSLEINDIIVLTSDLHTEGTTFQKLGVVLEWDSYLRSIRTLHSNGLSFAAGNNITFLRKENSDFKILNFLDTGNTQSGGLTYSTQIKRKENPLNVPLSFTQNGNLISAYFNLNSTPPGNTFINSETLGITGPNGFTFTALSVYMNNGSIGINTVRNSIQSQELLQIKVPKNPTIGAEVSIKQAFLDPNYTDTIEI